MTSKMTSEKCNEPRSEELCGSGRKFSLVGKRSTTGLTDKRRVFVQLVQMLSSCKCPFHLHHERRIHVQHLLHSNHICA